MGNVPFRKPSISRSDFSLGFPPLRCRTLTTWSQVAPLVHHQSVTPGRLETSLLKNGPIKKKKKYVYHDLLGFITILVGLYFSILNKWEHIFESINQRFSDMGNTKKKTDEHAGRIRLNAREKTVQYIRQTHTHTPEPHNLRFPFPFFCFPTWLFRKLDRIMQSYTTSYVHNHDTIYSITI